MAKKRRKATQAEKELARAVKTYNQRIDRALKSGRLRPETAPERKSVREIKARFAQMTPLQRGRMIAQEAKDLRRISNKNALELVKTSGGVEMTRFEYENSRVIFERAKRKQQAEDRKKRKAAATVPKLGGVPVREPAAWGEGIAPPNPEYSTDISGFREKVGSDYVFFEAGEWRLYRIYLERNFEKHYMGDDLAKLKEALAKISDTDLGRAYRAGEEFASQGYHYEESPDISAMLDAMEKYAA